MCCTTSGSSPSNSITRMRMLSFISTIVCSSRPFGVPSGPTMSCLGRPLLRNNSCTVCSVPGFTLNISAHAFGIGFYLLQQSFWPMPNRPLAWLPDRRRRSDTQLHQNARDVIADPGLRHLAILDAVDLHPVNRHLLAGRGNPK